MSKLRFMGIPPGIILGCFCLFIVLFPLFASAQEKRNDPGGGSDNPVVLPLKTIHSMLSKVDGSRCPMYPSCSAYGFEALRTHGLFKGWMLTCDRLVRCGRDELHLSPPIIVNGRMCCHDPLPGKYPTAP